MYIVGRNMIIDITGIELTPGNRRIDCLGNGKHTDCKGNLIECCCDECDYMMCCLAIHSREMYEHCSDADCPRKKATKCRF